MADENEGTGGKKLSECGWNWNVAPQMLFIKTACLHGWEWHLKGIVLCYQSEQNRDCRLFLRSC